MTWGVDDVDAHIIPVDCAVLGIDGNTPLTLLRSAVHDAAACLAQCSALPQQGIDEGSFTMIDVCDDGDITNLWICLDH